MSNVDLSAKIPNNVDLHQVNVEEGRHLWAMVYLLHSQFGRDGREEAEELLQRRSGNPDKPRILGAFNQPVDNWLDFFMFTMFTDRDGKYQLLALAESGFDPLSRTTRFMLTEEAHHMFVGETGVERIVARTAELMKADPNEDVRTQGGLPLPSKRFSRHIGLYADLPFDVEGRLLDRAEWEKRRDEWLPSEKDRGYVANLQRAVREPGQIANWIGKPARGIKGLPFEHQYV